MSSRPFRIPCLATLAVVLGALAAGAAHAQESPHRATPPERMMPEPSHHQQQPGSAGEAQKVQNVEKNPGDRMAPASKVEGTPGQPENNEATQGDVHRQEQKDGGAPASGAPQPPARP